MSAPFPKPEGGREALQAELTDAALAVISRYEVEGPAAERRRELWNALGPVVRQRREGAGARGWRELLVAEAADAAYHVALDQGFRGSFLDLELDIWKSLCRALA